MNIETHPSLNLNFNENLLKENEYDTINLKPNKYEGKNLYDFHDPQSTEVDSGFLGIDSLLPGDRYSAYDSVWTDVWQTSITNNINDLSETDELRTEIKSPKESSEYEQTEHNFELPPLDGKSKSIKKPKLSKSKKEDPKKNAPGLHRDRCIRCIKDLFKILKKDASIDSLKLAYENFETSTQSRFKFIIDALKSHPESFPEFMRFMDYIKKNFQKDWKDSKTWTRLKEFCSIKDFKKSGEIFKIILSEMMDPSKSKELDIWMKKFRGNEETKNYLISKQYKLDFLFHMNS